MVYGGDLAFSVVVFTLGAGIALALIVARRKKFGGELGGPPVVKFLSGIVLSLLWVFYVVLSIWKIFAPDATAEDQVWMIVKSIFFLQLVIVMVGCGVARLQKRKGDRQEMDVEAGRVLPCEGGMLRSRTGSGSKKFRRAVHASLAVIRLQRAVRSRIERSTPRWGAPKALDWAVAPVRGFSPPVSPRLAAFGKLTNRTSLNNHAPSKNHAAPQESLLSELSPDEALLRTISVAAMTSWAAVKMKNASSAVEPKATLTREPTVVFHDVKSPREPECSPHFQSAHVQQSHKTKSETPRRDSVAAAGKMVADWATNHAADWVTLSVAGWLAAQAAQAADASGTQVPQ